MSKSPLVNGIRKYVKCGTYHTLEKENCPECGWYLYYAGSIYQPRIRKGADLYSC